MTAEVQRPPEAIPLDLRQVSYFDKRSQVLSSQRTSKLLAQVLMRDAEQRSKDESPSANGLKRGETGYNKNKEKIIRAHFQEWTIGKTLGQGAFASVSEASTVVTNEGKTVPIRAVLKSSKVVPYTDMNVNDENRHQFLYVVRELTTLIHLSRRHPTFPGLDAACHVKYGHPSIVKIYDGAFDSEHREFHTFMERAKGIELFDYLRERGGKLPENEVKVIMKQLLRTLGEFVLSTLKPTES
ncbi:hypothetical protein HDU93_006245 [Gonapodya sp. JEL0774]|nr:hypothetical protein HDU93_006245 [Gonapodya sp. JEL0774]